MIVATDYPQNLNTKLKLYNHCIKYQVFSYEAFPDDIQIKCKKLKDDNTVHKNSDTHIQNKNQIRFDSIKRAKDKIIDIALLNDFEYFVTFTFNDKIVNALDYIASVKKLKKWLDNMVQRNGLKYLLVPELHKSGRIHFHALMSGDLKLQFSGHYDSKQREIYNVISWKYGFSTCVIIDGSYVACCKYITKYITKDLKKITGNFYYSGGHGLVRLPCIMYGDVNYDDFKGSEYDVPNLFAKVKYQYQDINGNNISYCNDI